MKIAQDGSIAKFPIYALRHHFLKDWFRAVCTDDCDPDHDEICLDLKNDFLDKGASPPPVTGYVMVPSPGLIMDILVGRILLIWLRTEE